MGKSCLTYSFYPRGYELRKEVGKSTYYTGLVKGRICSDNLTCCHTEMEAADQTCHRTQSQYADTKPTSPSANPITGTWPGRVATGVPMFKSLVWLDPEKIPPQAGFEPGIFRSLGGCLTTRPTRRYWLRITCVGRFTLLRLFIYLSGKGFGEERGRSCLTYLFCWIG